MDAPKPLFMTCDGDNLTLKQAKKIKFLDNQKEYLISIGKSSVFEKLGLQIKELSPEVNVYYEIFYSMVELQKINKYFRVFDEIGEVIQIIEEILMEKNANLKIEKDNAFLIIKINKIGKGEELIHLKLRKKALSLQDICDNLANEVKSLKIKVAEIEGLKKEIELIKKDNKKKDLIINELINWKKQMENKENKEIKYEKNEIKDIELEEEKLDKKDIEEEKLENKEANKIDEDKNNLLNIKIEKKKIDNIESEIIEQKEELNFLIDRLRHIESFKNNNILFKLIFRATRDGNLPKNFHEKCDGIEKTIVVIKTIKGIKFGGYVNKKWSRIGGWVKNDEDCFLFSIELLKIYNPIKDKKKYILGENLIFSEFGLSHNLFDKSSLNILKRDESNKYFTGFTTDYEINGGEREFKVEELEVFQIVAL